MFEKFSSIQSLLAHHGRARRNIFKIKVLRWLKNAILRLVFKIQCFIREPFCQSLKQDLQKVYYELNFQSSEDCILVLLKFLKEVSSDVTAHS